MSSRIVPTTIIGPKGILRDSLAALLGGYSYRVTDSCQTVADMPVSPEEEGPRMVVLTGGTVDHTVAESAHVRRRCQNCKIVVVLENLQNEDFQKLAHSAIDGCVAVGNSQDVLSWTLDLVIAGARIIVLADEPCLNISPPEDGQKAGSGNGRGPSLQNQSDTGDLLSAAAVLALSGRERQIIDGLVKGQSNKLIARGFGIAEATVKVHMKAILRKVACSNRTQVAIWALEHGDILRAPELSAL